MIDIVNAGGVLKDREEMGDYPVGRVEWEKNPPRGVTQDEVLWSGRVFLGWRPMPGMRYAVGSEERWWAERTGFDVAAFEKVVGDPETSWKCVWAFDPEVVVEVTSGLKVLVLLLKEDRERARRERRDVSYRTLFLWVFRDVDPDKVRELVSSLVVVAVAGRYRGLLRSLGRELFSDSDHPYRGID